MSTSQLSRRSLVTSAAALPALAVPSIAVTAAQSDDDHVLHNLWSKYLVYAAAHEAAAQKYRPARAAFDAEMPPCPEGVLLGDHWQAHVWLQRKHGLDVLYRTMDETTRRMDDVTDKILEARANTLFGIGVKLAALPAGFSMNEGVSRDADDYIDRVASVLSDTNRLIGTDFVGMQIDDEEVA